MSQKIKNTMTKTERFFKRLPFTTFFDSKFIGNALDKKLLENVKKNDIEEVKKYLKYGADINSRDENKKNALMIALENENYNMAEFLINEGIKLFVRDKLKRTSIHYAASVGKDLKFVSLVLSKIPKEKQIKVVNLQDKFGDTPLIMAVRNRNYYVVNHLIRIGANKYKVNLFEEDVFSIAREKGYDKILELLHKTY